MREMLLWIIEASTTEVVAETPESTLHLTRVSPPLLEICHLASSHSQLAPGHTSLGRVGGGAGFGEDTTTVAAEEKILPGLVQRRNKARRESETRLKRMASRRSVMNQVASQETSLTFFRAL